ncbi:MAG: hypothetical protein CL886_08310 [Dehalococcoidia bacterium]|nr:hypothetical protein [Dehalococcoidia bacterium]
MTSYAIGRVQKALQYSSEPSRVNIKTFSATFQGNHGTHEVMYNQDHWSCNCQSYPYQNICSHTMALQNILDQILSVTG